MQSNIATELIQFIKTSPSAFHAVDTMKKAFLANGFTALAENERWNLKAGGQYFITRNDSSIIAFSIPENGFHGMRIMASHSDSPSFKINFYHIMSCAIRGSWFSLLWPTYPFKYSSRSPYIIIPSKTSYIVMLFLPYFDSFCKYKFIFHRRFLYYHRFSPFFFVNFANF